MVLSVLYIAFQRILQLVFLLFRATEFKELEIVVLRHELSVLRRQVGRPTFRSADRWFLAAASRMLPRGHATDSLPSAWCVRSPWWRLESREYPAGNGSACAADLIRDNCFTDPGRALGR